MQTRVASRKRKSEDVDSEEFDSEFEDDDEDVEEDIKEDEDFEWKAGYTPGYSHAWVCAMNVPFGVYLVTS